MTGAAWTAILLAGERPGENQFAAAHGVRFKALVPVGGEAMLSRTLRTLITSDGIARIVVLAQQPDAVMAAASAELRADSRIATASGGDGISSSIAAIAGGPAAPFPLLVTTADHALLTPAMVESFLARTEGVDAAFALVERSVVEARFPTTQRTWLRFSDGDYSGANLFALRTPASRKALDLWSSVEKDRKKAARLMMSFGPLLALRALTRTISLDAALKRLGRRVGLTVRAIRMPFAEAAVDVDKEADLALAETVLAERSFTRSQG